MVGGTFGKVLWKHGVPSFEHPSDQASDAEPQKQSSDTKIRSAWRLGKKCDNLSDVSIVVPKLDLASPTKPQGGVKHDAGKAPVMRGVFMRFPRAMFEVARVSQTGTTKYAVPISDMEYVNVKDGFGRYTDALGRHLLEEAIGGHVSVETGGELPPGGAELIHAAQAAWDALARLEILLIALEKAGKWGSRSGLIGAPPPDCP
jgi:hypothetical protein